MGIASALKCPHRPPEGSPDNDLAAARRAQAGQMGAVITPAKPLRERGDHFMLWVTCQVSWLVL